MCVADGQGDIRYNRTLGRQGVLQNVKVYVLLDGRAKLSKVMQGEAR